ncbi:MAG: MerR family transcriptional regulator [Peptococcaceae bacterium]|nr:MAG: MerR family transcriptional regulator [Peptococcaceae bacterium]
MISVAARLAGAHPRTLRIYESFGLITPARTEGNTRVYSENDIIAVRKIRYLTRKRGVNLAGIKIILEMEKRLGISIIEDNNY